MSASPEGLRPGVSSSITRTFTVDEVRDFAQLSGDLGTQHTLVDAEGRLMVHGLLLASLPTQIGGQMNFLARELHFEFLKPGWTGTPIRCVVTIAATEETPRGLRLECRWECTDAQDQVLMRGHGRGLAPRQNST